MFPRFPKQQYFWKVPRFRPFVVLVKAICTLNEDENGAIGEMILIRKIPSTGRKTCPNTTLSTKNLVYGKALVE